MAEHIAKSYSCDRCGIDIGAQKPSKNMSVRANRNGEWAPEFDIKWDDFCADCDAEVSQFFTRKIK